MLGHHTRGGFFVDREEISYKISCACQIPRSICNCREQFPHKNWNTASDCPPSEDETSDPQSFHDQKEDVLVPSSSLSINPCFNFHTRFNFAKWLIYWSKQWIQEKRKERKTKSQEFLKGFWQFSTGARDRKHSSGLSSVEKGIIENGRRNTANNGIPTKQYKQPSVAHAHCQKWAESCFNESNLND